MEIATETMMVELLAGLGDGYGVVAVRDGVPLLDNWGTKRRGSKRLVPTVSLLDGGVRVDAGAIVRVIGPLDCPEAIRIRIGRYMRNADYGSVRALLAAMSDDECRAVVESTHWHDALRVVLANPIYRGIWDASAERDSRGCMRY